MKTGTATIDINEYDKMVESIRTSNEEYNQICKVLYKFCAACGNKGYDNEAMDIMTEAGYTIEISVNKGKINLGRGLTVIKIGMK